MDSHKNGRLSDLLSRQLSEKEVTSYDDLSAYAVRSIIFHLLYAMEGFDYDASLEALVDNFNRGFDLDIPLESKVVAIARQVIEERGRLDEEIKPLLHNWRFERIGVCTKLILRFAIWELLETDTTVNIVINEAIELAKCFAEKDSYKFINGLLDEKIKIMGRKQELKE